MRIALVIPKTKYFDYIEHLIEKEYKEIKAVCFYYDDYSEVQRLVGQRQKEFDALLFAGAAPYRYMKQYCKQEIIWDYIYHSGASIHRALLEASMDGQNLQKISFDGCTRESLEEIYQELGQEIGDCQQITYREVGDIDQYNHIIYQIHRENCEKKLTECCLTSLNTVYAKLKAVSVPVYFIFPTHDACREAIQRVYTTYLTQINQHSQIVVLSIEVDLPNEYSVVAQNEYGYQKDKFVLSSLFYAFAEKLQAAAVEVTYRNYLIFTTKNMLETITENLYEFEILRQVREMNLNAVYMGIGYGEKVSEAKRNANQALIMAKKEKENTAFVVYANHSIRGPITASNVGTRYAEGTDGALYTIAKKADVKLDKLIKVRDVMTKLERDSFTTKELSNYLAVTTRSVDRMIQKLEEAGFAKVVDHKVVCSLGRPSRIIQFTFNKATVEPEDVDEMMEEVAANLEPEQGA